MTITNYTIEDSEGNDQDFLFDDYREAQEHAEAHKMKVICNTYVFDDSWMVDDFTEKTTVRNMTQNELGQYVCVMNCQEKDITIRTDGVWVKTGALYSSAHRDCYERETE